MSTPGSRSPSLARRGQKAPKPKVVLVRQPVHSVRPQDQPDRTPMRLAIAIAAALGGLLVVWTAGTLGFRLGFAPLARVPDLSIGAAGGLAVGTGSLIALPGMVISAGIARPELLMLGFALIALPAAGLAASRWHAPGGPRLARLEEVLSAVAAVFAGLNAVTLVWWSASGTRGALLGEIPWTLAEVAPWADNLRVAAGLDAFGVASAVLWVVLVMRLPIPAWVRGVSASVCFFSVVVIFVAMSMSSAAASQVHARRGVSVGTTGSLDGRLVLGSTAHQQAEMVIDRGAILVELRDASEPRTVLRTASIVEFAAEAAVE